MTCDRIRDYLVGAGALALPVSDCVDVQQIAISYMEVLRERLATQHDEVTRLAAQNTHYRSREARYRETGIKLTNCIREIADTGNKTPVELIALGLKKGLGEAPQAYDPCFRFPETTCVGTEYGPPDEASL